MVTPTVKEEVNPAHEAAAAAFSLRNEALGQAAELLQKAIGEIPKVIAEKDAGDAYGVIGDVAVHVSSALAKLSEAAEQHKKTIIS